MKGAKTLSIRKAGVLLIAAILLINVFGTVGILTMANNQSASVEAYEVMQISERPNENLLGTWMSFGSGFQTKQMENSKGKVGTVYKIENFAAGKDAGMAYSIPNPTLGTYTFSGYSKAENVKRVIGTEYFSYALMVNIYYADGTEKQFHTQYEYGTHGWEYQEFSFTLQKPTSNINCYVFLRSPATGTAYFDDLRLTLQADAPDCGVFDNLPVKIVKKAEAQKTESTLSTGDGLEIGLGATQVTSLKIDGQELKNDAFSGFLVRDIAETNHRGIYSFGTAKGSEATQFLGNQPTLGLNLKANYKAEKNCIKVDGVLTEEKSSTDGRAVQLSYALPITASGWKMGTSVLDTEEITTGKSWADYKPLGEGVLSVVDWDSQARTYFPTACIYNEDLGIAIAAGMNYPTYWELEYNGSTGQYVITYQMGIVKEAPEAAKFEFVIYKLDDPAWGFRSAMQKYTEIYPENYEVREKDQGLWVAWATVENLIDIEDFNLIFKEIGNETRTGGIFEISKGIKGLFYFELGDWWLPHLAADDEAAVWDRIHQVAEGDEDHPVFDTRKAVRQAMATEFCKVLDQNGKIAWNPVDNGWCPNGAQVHVNANPALPGKYNFLTVWLSEQTKKVLFDPMEATGSVFDGIYLDEFSGWWLGNANFNKEHYPYTTVPLTYSPYFKRPMLHRASTTWECAKTIADYLHSSGRTLFANKTPDKNAWNTCLLDAMGTEQTALSGSVYQPQTIQQLSTWRTLAYQKPFCILFNNDYNLLDNALMERYFNRCMAYGIFPSPGMHSDSVTGSSEYYWNGPSKFYERDRELFKKYMPTLKTIAEAGWEPVTYASTANQDIIVERYGNDDAEGIYFSVYNPTDSPVEVQLNVDLSHFDLSDGCVYQKMISGMGFSINNNVVPLQLDPDRTEVLSIRDPAKATKREEEQGQEQSGGTIGGGNSSSGNAGNTNGGGSWQSVGATQMINKHVTTTNNPDLKRTINHHLTKKLNNIINNTTFPWTVALIALDAIAAGFGVTTFLLWNKKRKQGKTPTE